MLTISTLATAIAALKAEDIARLQIRRHDKSASKLRRRDANIAAHKAFGSRTKQVVLTTRRTYESRIPSAAPTSAPTLHNGEEVTDNRTSFDSVGGAMLVDDDDVFDLYYPADAHYDHYAIYDADYASSERNSRRTGLR